MNNIEYQRLELKRWYTQMNSKTPYFDNLADFVTRWGESSKDDLLTQLKWIENGTYGAGACFGLQVVLSSITPRMNAVAHIGRFFLSALWGSDFTKWNKLPRKMQLTITSVVNAYMKQKPDFAQKLGE